MNAKAPAMICAHSFSSGANPNQSPGTFGDGGTTPNVSSNQENPGTGVVWTIARGNPVHLQAYDATNLTHKLFDLDAGPWTSGNGMIEPTPIQGKVYVAAGGVLTVFGPQGRLMSATIPLSGRTPARER